MPKVLITTDSLSNGGAERQLTLLAEHLPPEWERRVWSMDGGPFTEELEKYEIQVDICYRRWRWDISPVGKLWRLVRQWRPDVIHSWGWMTTLASFPLSKILGIPLVNGIIRSGKPYYYRSAMNRIASHFGDVVVSNSQSGLRNWGINPSKGVVIYNGFDRNRVSKNFNSTDPQLNDKFIVVMAARMSREKDFALFISTLRKLIDMGKMNWKFLAIGQGEDREALIKENTDLIQEGFLQFPDAGLDVIPFLQTSNVGVLLTKSKYHQEGCSNTIMEYMACGLPVIASDNGGNRELVENNRTGFIVPDGDLDDLVNKLLWFFDHPSETKRFGNEGRERLVKNFSTEKMVKSTINLYESLIN